MTGRLTDRVVVVTGGGQGLGKAYVTRLFEAGARVAAVDLAGDKAKAVATSLDLDRVVGIEADVTDGDRMLAVADEVHRRWGRIDGLVNNAGGAMYPTAPIETVPRKQWDNVLAVNLTAQYLCTVAVLDAMRDRGYGKIVNICSASLYTGGPIGLAPYIAAKGGVLGLTRALAHELGRHNICVNAVSPGWTPVDTPKAVHDGQASAALSERVVAEQCLPRVETPQDLVGIIEFLCSADSDFITGQVFNVDGGWTHN